MKESTRKALEAATKQLVEQFDEQLNDDGWKYHSAKRFIGITEHDNLVMVDMDLGGKVAAFYFAATDAKPLKEGEKAKKKKTEAKPKKAKRRSDEDEEDEDDV